MNDNDDRPNGQPERERPEPIHKDGFIWGGTRESLEAWKRTSGQRRTRSSSAATRCVGTRTRKAGRVHAGAAPRPGAGDHRIGEVLLRPSGYGIEGGKISKLTIQRRRTDLMAQVLGKPWEQIGELYNYDRGLDVDRLSEDALAKKLYEAIIEELN